MKKITITLFLSLIILCSCGETASEVSKGSNETESLTVSESSTAPLEVTSDISDIQVPTTLTENTPNPESEKTIISNDNVPEVAENGLIPVPTVDSTYISAEEITSLVDLNIQIGRYLNVEAPNYDFENSVHHNNNEYYPVIDGKFDTWEEWEAYIRSAYTDKLAEERLAYDSIVNIDGKTYCLGGGMSYDLTDEYTYEIISDEPEKITVHVKNSSVWNDEDPAPSFDEKDYVLVKIDSGWKIEDIVF